MVGGFMSYPTGWIRYISSSVSLWRSLVHALQKSLFGCGVFGHLVVVVFGFLIWGVLKVVSIICCYVTYVINV